MEKLPAFVRRLGAPLMAAAILSGCHGPEIVALNDDQQAELTAYVATYRECVAQSVATLDDGQSAIVQIAGMAQSYCEPEAHGVAAFLNSTRLPEAVKAQRIENIVKTANDQSALMLRQLRSRSGGMRQI